MKLYRFIGEQEAKMLLWNETIENRRDWSEYCDTNSIGICFFANNRTNDMEKIVETALDTWGFSGIVKTFAIVEIEVETARKAWGWYSGGKRTEYNLTSYSIENVKAMYTLDNHNWTDSQGKMHSVVQSWKVKKVY